MTAASKTPKAGFTLIEVILSIALLAFAITIIMAALAAGNSYAANDARRSLATNLIQRVFHDIELTDPLPNARSPMLGLNPVNWNASPQRTDLWFDANGNPVPSRNRAFFRLELTTNRDPSGALGHLHARVAWPATTTRADGSAECFTSLLLP